MRHVGIEYASIVDHPIDEVFAWHTRPGAMRRLVPPWQPMRVVAETSSLADGVAILGLPAGLRWIARHDPTGYDPPYQFVDVLSSDGLMTLPPRVIGWWRQGASAKPYIASTLTRASRLPWELIGPG